MQCYKTKDKSRGELYIVPTPIGNLSDITQRALAILQYVDLIAAEDTKHTSLLLQHFSIKTYLFAFHSRNEQQKTKELIKKLREGKNIALVSNAGTPLINDPGYYLVRSCHKIGIRVIPLPGACAAIVALSASGLPSNHFCYEGFLPKRSKARRNLLKSLETETRTIIFYESTHRILDSLEDMITVWGEKRYIVLARELTKIWETIYGAQVASLFKWFKENGNCYKGEIVLVVEGCKIKKKNFFSTNELRTLAILRNDLPFNKAVALTAKIYNIKKRTLYKYVIEQQK